MSLIDKVTAISALIIALGVIASALIRFYKWISKPKENEEDIKEITKKQEDDSTAITKKQEEDIKAIKSEQCMHTYVLLAILDGLKQQGCNGPVTEARDRLSKYINKQAHDMESSV